MRTWSSELLKQELAVYAMANIIDGVIKYAIDRKSSDALEEAYLIAREINDPSLKAQSVRTDRGMLCPDRVYHPQGTPFHDGE